MPHEAPTIPRRGLRLHTGRNWWRVVRVHIRLQACWEGGAGRTRVSHDGRRIARLHRHYQEWAHRVAACATLHRHDDAVALVSQPVAVPAGVGSLPRAQATSRAALAPSLRSLDVAEHEAKMASRRDSALESERPCPPAQRQDRPTERAGDPGLPPGVTGTVTSTLTSSGVERGPVVDQSTRMDVPGAQAGPSLVLRFLVVVPDRRCRPS